LSSSSGSKSSTKTTVCVDGWRSTSPKFLRRSLSASSIACWTAAPSPKITTSVPPLDQRRRRGRQIQSQCWSFSFFFSFSPFSEQVLGPSELRPCITPHTDKDLVSLSGLAVWDPLDQLIWKARIMREEAKWHAEKKKALAAMRSFSFLNGVVGSLGNFQPAGILKIRLALGLLCLHCL